MTMNETQLLEVSRKCGAMMTGSHIKLRSGKHGSSFFDPRFIFMQAEALERFIEQIYSDTRDALPFTEVIVARPESMAGATHFRSMIESLMVTLIPSLHRRTQTDRVIIEFDLFYASFIHNRHVFFVEDVATTAATLQAMIDGIRNAGGQVVGGALLANRGGITAEQLGIPFLTSALMLTGDEWKAWDPAECPLCKKGKPLEWEVDDKRGFLVKV